MKRWWAVAAMAVALTVGLTPVGTSAQAAKTTLYLVATAHLDSQWNWTVQDSIRDHIPKTFHTNFEYFEKYPDYKFSWEGAIHYMWFKEYHPDEWAKVQQYVAADRWRLAGSWIDAVDTNMPSPESLFRQALYAQRFFREEFKKEPKDIYLPDCFGFGFALPSIAAHSGLIAFSTQKLTWGRPIPFPIGRWKGVDGSEIVAELNPGGYGTRLTEDITLQSTNGGTGTTPWLNDPTDVGSGDSLEFRYFGTGDTGGGPTEPSVQFVQKALATPPPNLTVKNTSPDQLAKDLTPAQRESLPIYNDELILKTHGTGCYTSQAAMKRFNRTNELLADAAEKSGVAALYLSGEPYPTERLRDAWIRFLWHQFHDDLTGTCIPQAYQFSWNDEIASLNQFAAVLTSSTSAVASLLDTSGTGTPLVVYNPVSMPRREPVEAIAEDRTAGCGRQRRERQHGRGRAGADRDVNARGDARRVSRGCAVDGLRRVSREGGRGGASAGGGSDVAQGHDVDAREQPHPREARRERRHRVDLRQGREARAAVGADHARAARQSVAVVARVGGAVRDGAVAGARVRREPDGQSHRARARAGRPRDHAQGRGFDVRAARALERGRRSDRGREPRRLALAQLRAQGVVPAHGVESEGDLRPRPRHDRAHEQRARQVRSAGAEVG